MSGDNVDRGGEHVLVHYRPVGVDRWETPADVCEDCSDFEAGRLVPVSFCAIASRRSEEKYTDYLKERVT